MLSFIVRRVGFSLLLARGVSFATFALVFSNGPAIARTILGADATEAAGVGTHRQARAGSFGGVAVRRVARRSRAR